MAAGEVLRTILGYCWDMLSFEIPGLSMSCKDWVITLMIINLSIFMIKYALDLGPSSSGYRSGHSGRKHIAENRKDDTH